jgi:hypothetical protein
MKHILDSAFQYRPSFDTDVRKTFEKVRRQLQARDRAESKPDGEITVKVLQLDQLKKVASS